MALFEALGAPRFCARPESLQRDAVAMAKCATIFGSLLLALTVPAAAQQPGTIVGIVRSAGAPASGARVGLRGTLAFAATTDSTGRFILREVPPGEYVVVATLDGSNSGTAPAMVRGGDTVMVAIALGGPVELSGITVTADKSDGYRADSATGGTKFPVPLMDMPQVITVVTRAVIDDRHITNPVELPQNVSGVIAVPPYTGRGLNEANYVFRGIPSASGMSTLHDGFRDFGAIAPVDMASVDHVEFLMGPESVLYGSVGSPGGLANFISKQPLARQAAALTTSADVHGDVRSTVDLGGPFSTSGRTGYRLNAALERVRDFGDYTDGSYAFSVTPVVQWRPGPRTSITFTGSYIERKYRGDPFLPLYEGVFRLPVTRFYGEPAAPKSLVQALAGQVIATYQVSPTVRLREGLGYSSTRLSDYNYDLEGFADSLGTTLARGYGHSDETAYDVSSQTELLATFMTGGARNRMIAGLELSAEQHPGFFTGANLLAPISIDHPVYGAALPDTASVNGWHNGISQLGLYAQDLIDIGHQVKVIFGARFDLNRSKDSLNLVDDSLPIQVGQATVQHLSPRLGLVYQPTQATSVYGSWTTSFWPNENCARCGNAEPFPPETGQQFEVGVKQLFAHGRLGATLAVYQLDRQDITLPDPSDPSGRRLVVAGGMQSRGVSLDASGSLAPGLGVVVAYAYTDARVNQGNDIVPIGTRPANQPRNRVSLWSTYTVRSGSISGMEFGAGLTAADDRLANWFDPYSLPGYTILDALWAYHGRSFGVQLNFTNLTDTRSYQGISYTQLAPGAPRSVVTTVSYQF